MLAGIAGLQPFVSLSSVYPPAAPGHFVEGLSSNPKRFSSDIFRGKPRRFHLTKRIRCPNADLARRSLSFFSGAYGELSRLPSLPLLSLRRIFYFSSPSEDLFQTFLIFLFRRW